ncbi:Cyanovirin-N [Cordyceps fumosorosea ARSEF 2679]|uniref:Cyanovirin-N n=1 Tax=Cordyceps fumosorosea (strain ARSEF 2679) TaxID=1081104 RepID=A0A168DH60_CORFA|nr:Cyanovirin-N [Cordyceps fumosorosea ARSEF 2679]OAA72610.1 Cyanovirin-N [Cordyceps fumosorosea ARSEF 2679]
MSQLCGALLLAAAAAAAAAAVTGASAASCHGFAGTCGRAIARNGTSGHPGPDMLVYATYCFDQAGERNYNPTVEINTCLSNTFGRLTPGTGFAYSCRDFGIDPIASVPNVFYATCADGKGNEMKTQIDLSMYKTTLPPLYPLLIQN